MSGCLESAGRPMLVGLHGTSQLRVPHAQHHRLSLSPKLIRRSAPSWTGGSSPPHPLVTTQWCDKITAVSLQPNTFQQVWRPGSVARATSDTTPRAVAIESGRSDHPIEYEFVPCHISKLRRRGLAVKFHPLGPLSNARSERTIVSPDTLDARWSPMT